MSLPSRSARSAPLESSAVVDRPVLTFAESCQQGARMLVDTCARLRAGERAYVLGDAQTAEVADFVAEACRHRRAILRAETIEGPAIHGGSPPPQVGANMLWADVVFCLTSMSLAHTEERFAASRKGTRYLSLPDYSLDLLAGASLQFDFASAVAVSQQIKSRLDSADEIHLTTAAGTDLRCRTTGRAANACPGVVWEPGTLGSPPDAETNIAPLERTASGVVVVDGSIPCREIGRLRDPVTLEIVDGAIANYFGPSDACAALDKLFARVGRPEARLLAEFGIGLNQQAKITGRMLDDEGCAGTIHLGFGSNATIGGVNRVPFHLDFVVREPRVLLDGQPLLDRGVLQLDDSTALRNAS